MAVYAIGDIQGCHTELLRLLDRLRFDPTADRLWFAGDLVNRGPDSLSTLRLVHDLGETALCVLGNHDLHMLAVAQGSQTPKSKDNFGPVLSAPDAAPLLEWLRHRPLMHHDPQLGYALVHAGLYPPWSLAEGLRLAADAEAALRGADYRALFDAMYGDRPDAWSADLVGNARLRFIINSFTRMRFVDCDGRLDMHHKGPPGSQPDGLVPWYASALRREHGVTILFGHWSTHGSAVTHNTVPLDTGCLWGGQLTAMRLDGPAEFTRIDCPGARRPG